MTFIVVKRFPGKFTLLLLKKLSSAFYFKLSYSKAKFKELYACLNNRAVKIPNQ